MNPLGMRSDLATEGGIRRERGAEGGHVRWKSRREREVPSCVVAVMLAEAQ